MENMQKDSETISLKKIIVDYLYHWKVFLVAACISLVCAILYMVLYPQTYEFVARIKIQEDKNLGSGGSMGLGEAAGLMKSFGLGSISGGAVNIDDEIAIMSSNDLLKKVIIRLGLNVTYKKPYSLISLYEDSPLLIIPDSLTQENLDCFVSFKIEVSKNGAVLIKMKETGKEYSFASLPAQLRVPEGVFDILYGTEGDVTKKIVFSGDIGNVDQPIIKDPSYTDSADYIVVESTYGNRIHTAEKPDYLGEFTRIIKETFDRGGNVVIPSFAVGRTQEMLYFIREIKEKHLLPEYEDFDVYLDSPLAIEATKVFTMNMRDCFDKEAMELVNAGINPLVFPGLHISTTSDDSKMINFIEKPKVIISASGMCDAGRIRHHLKHNLWRPECTILFVGYQANGTLGRSLIEGEKNVKLFGEPIEVHAHIESLHGVSGHADMNGLLSWIGAFVSPIERVFVVHGEDTVTEEFAHTVEEKFGYSAWAPYPCCEADLLKNEIVNEGVRVPVKAKKAARRKSDSAFERLVAAGRRLLDIIYKNEGLSNKDKAKFETQINNLSDKWED